jgi:phosphoribosylanthranilate isomerase
MALITKVKAGSVSSLSDARYFAGMGVDWLGFDIDPDSPHYVSPELYQSLAGWVTGPKRVVELPALSKIDFKNILEIYSPDAWEVDALQLQAVKSNTNLPVFVRVDLDKTQVSPESLIVADLIIVTTGQPLQKKEIVTSLSKVADVFLSIESHDLDAKSLLTILPLAGICLKGSPETKVGLKDYNFADLLESLDAD